MVMLDEIIQRHAYNNNSNTSPLKPRQDKTRQNKVRQSKAKQDEIYIDSLHIMTMTTTMTIIIQ